MGLALARFTREGLRIIDKHTLPAIRSEVQSITEPIDCQLGDAGILLAVLASVDLVRPTDYDLG